MREDDEMEFFTKIEEPIPKKLNPYTVKSNRNLTIMKKKKQNATKICEIIISHLSTKRKDHNIERFEKLFQNFDKAYAEFRNSHNL